MKRVVCYSGGTESALAAIEVVRKYGKEGVVLLNHDICKEAEDTDIKQYKLDIANYLELPVTDCSASERFPHLDPLRTCMSIEGFKWGKGTEMCTYMLKTKPFQKYLKAHCDPADTAIYYGFNAAERNRCERRVCAMAEWHIDFPLLWVDRTIHNTAEIGIPAPKHYDTWVHGNCIGCLKAGWQHWYCVYVLRRDRWELAKEAEKSIGYTIKRRAGVPCSLASREEEFQKMLEAGVPATEHLSSGQFWRIAKRKLREKLCVKQMVDFWS